MAISPATAYPGKIDTSDPVGYPNGKARNISSPGDGTGTPLEAQWLNDFYGWVQAVLDDNGGGSPVVPSGTPDKVGASQILTALKAIIVNEAGGGGFGFNENKQAAAYVLLSTDYGSDNDKTIVYTGSVDADFTNLTSASLSAGDYVFFEHRGTAGLMNIKFANASDRIGALALGITNRKLSPGEVIRLQLTSDANIWRLG